MYQNTDKGPDDTEYMEYHAFDTETTDDPSINLSHLPEHDPLHTYCYPSHSSNMNLTQPAQLGQSDIHFAIHPYIPLADHGLNDSMPHLSPQPNIAVNYPSHPMNFNTFERSTAASEYSYSDHHGAGSTRHAVTRHGSYSPSAEFEAYGFPAPATNAKSNYLEVHSGPSHHGSSSYPSLIYGQLHMQTSSTTGSRVAPPSESSSTPQITSGTLLDPASGTLLDPASEACLDPASEATCARRQRTRKPFEPERRLEVKRMRQTGACFRCRWLKKPCGEGTPCPQCVGVRGRVWTYPCMRVNMTDLSGLSDLGLQNHQRSFLNSSILGWTGAEATIHITHGFGTSLSVVVEEIVPRAVENLCLQWPSENKRSSGTIWRWFDEFSVTGCFKTQTLPYAFRRFQISERELDSYLDCDRGRVAPGCVPGVHVDSLHGLDFTKTMMRAAWDYAELANVSMIKKAFRVKTAVYLQNYFLQYEVDETANLGARAIAPALVQFQLDLLIDGRRAELEKELLAELQKTVFSRQRKYWLSIFFTTYILLTTLEATLWNHYAWKTKGFESQDFSCERAQEITDVLVSVYQAMNQNSHPFLKSSDGEEITNALTEAYGEGANASFDSVRALINSQGPVITQRKNAIFNFHDQFSLEGKFSSLLVLA